MKNYGNGKNWKHASKLIGIIKGIENILITCFVCGDENALFNVFTICRTETLYQNILFEA